MQNLIAFHGKQEIKDFYLARVRAHKAADEIIHGRYWQNGKGCAVGCTIHSGDHAAYETEMGIPRILARLEDDIFESISNGRAKEWPEKFLAAITPGADLNGVWPRFAVWLLVDPKYGVLQFAKTNKSKSATKAVSAIQAVADAYQCVVDGKTTSVNWMGLRRDAADADDAAYAAVAAAAYAAASDAYAAAYAAVAAVATVAAAAAAYAAVAAARRQEWRNAQADKLIELMASAPMATAVIPVE